MRIKRVECDQFAGLTGRELELDKGLNIVVGENESGKSTIVDLIYQLLFKDAKLDGRRDSDYIEKYCNLKQELASKYKDERSKYTQGKNDFIKDVIRKAKEEYDD